MLLSIPPSTFLFGCNRHISNPCVVCRVIEGVQQHRWAIAPQYIEHIRMARSIFKVSAPTMQRNCPSMFSSVSESNEVTSVYDPGGIVPSDTQNIRLTIPEYLDLRVPNCGPLRVPAVVRLRVRASGCLTLCNCSSTAFWVSLHPNRK